MFKQLMNTVPKETRGSIMDDQKCVDMAVKNLNKALATRIKPETPKWRIKGMKSSLFHHQILGLDFMIAKERGEYAPFGGINADVMGFGKTVQILATMTANLPDASARDNNIGTTLLVVPSSLTQQWQDEIEKHVESGVFANVHHYKRSRGVPLIYLQQQDILITSYAEVRTSLPFPNKQQKEELTELDGSSLRDWLSEHRHENGDLHQMKFHRIVLDESQAIKNHHTRTSIACSELDGKLRWAISGTPIENRLEELFPYMRFLKIPYYSHSFAEFQRACCDPDSDLSARRVLALLRASMIRRTLKDRLFGRPIVELPPAASYIVRVEFSPRERLLYDAIETCYRFTFNKFIKKGTAKRHYHLWIVMLTCHLEADKTDTIIAENAIQEMFSEEELTKLKDKIGQQADNFPFYNHMNRSMAVKALTGTPVGHPGLGVAGGSQSSNEMIPTGRGSFGSTMDFNKYLDLLGKRQERNLSTCNDCYGFPEDPVKTECGHVFCRQCLQKNANMAATETNSEFKSCPRCGELFNRAEPYVDPLSQQLDGDELEESSELPWIKVAGPLPASTKTMALKRILLEWRNSAPNDKIVIFTQFRLTIKILKKVCEEEGLEYVTYTGDMSAQSRIHAVKKLEDESSISIMLAGLRCGGVGLNLNVANRVMSVDFWWNNSVEQQAFGRVFRLGQTKPSTFVRLAVKATVDDRMLAMQDRKARIISEAMGDNDIGKPRKGLSFEDLGHVKKDAAGNLTIEPDNNVANQRTTGSQPGGFTYLQNPDMP
ncbi:MAG: hypothetical protein M4579_007205 [Chaenotheca gracillima]|nr:MAG: hypothetical protein M4579_007205 [Chaenotheca gracillima]